MHLLTTFEMCGCWLGMAFHGNRFVRIIILRDGVVAIESRVTTTQPIPIEELLDRNEITTRYMWDLQAEIQPQYTPAELHAYVKRNKLPPKSVDLQALSVLTTTATRALHLADHMIVDQPLPWVPQPSVSLINGILARNGIEDLVEDDHDMVDSRIRRSCSCACNDSETRSCTSGGRAMAEIFLMPGENLDDVMDVEEEDDEEDEDENNEGEDEQDEDGEDEDEDEEDEDDGYEDDGYEDDEEWGFDEVGIFIAKRFRQMYGVELDHSKETADFFKNEDKDEDEDEVEDDGTEAEVVGDELARLLRHLKGVSAVPVSTLEMDNLIDSALRPANNPSSAQCPRYQ